MAEKEIRVRMFGEFSIELDGSRIDDNSSHARKVWQLLSYIIFHRHRQISQAELRRMLSGKKNEEYSSSAVRVLFHRTRAVLNELGHQIGQQLIVSHQGHYIWNNDFPLYFDVEEFEALCLQSPTLEEADRLGCYRQALALYQGDLLPKLAGETWVIPAATYFHNLYVKTVQELILMLEVRRQHQEAISLCKATLRLEPYNEELYLRLIANLLATGNQKGAIAAYEELRRLLLSTFGAMPMQAIRDLYNEALHRATNSTMPLATLLEQIQEPGKAEGPLTCPFECFKSICAFTVRLADRSADAAYIGEISIWSKDGKELTAHHLERAMENLQEQICRNLHRGDVLTRCSMSQFALLFFQADAEESRIICEGIIKSFYRQYPHALAKLSYAFIPLVSIGDGPTHRHEEQGQRAD